MSSFLDLNECQECFIRKIVMMRYEDQTKYHRLLAFGAFALALAFRLIRLNNPALNDYEAEIALQALEAARGSGTQFGSQAAYVGLTGFLFYIFSASNFLARFLPALIGSLIIFVPLLFREQIGSWSATILAVILAISPEMVGLSRIIGSPMMAFVLLLLSLGLFIRRKPILMGIALALGLMSGEGFWVGGFILGLSYLVAERFFNISEYFQKPLIERHQLYGLYLGISFLATIIVVGTGFFLSPANLSGVFSGLISFVRGFVTPNSMPFVLKPLSLIAYTSSAVILGIWGSLRGVLIRNKIDLFLLCWWVCGAAFIFLYPAGETADMIWVTLPLWILSVRVVFSAFRFPQFSRFVMLITTIAVIIVAAFMLIAMRSLLSTDIGDNTSLNTFLALLLGLVLLVVIVLLVSYGWSDEIALPGLLLGLAVVFCAGLFAMSVRSTGLAPETSCELWYPNEVQISPEWVELTIDRVKDWNALRETPLEIAVSEVDTPSMRWVLREEAPVYFASYLPTSSEPGILITDVQEMPEISSSYRGQDLVWSREILWNEMSAFDYLKWLITRDAPTAFKEIIIWARMDLMPDDRITP